MYRIEIYRHGFLDRRFEGQQSQLACWEFRSWSWRGFCEVSTLFSLSLTEFGGCLWGAGGDEEGVKATPWCLYGLSDCSSLLSKHCLVWCNIKQGNSKINCGTVKESHPLVNYNYVEKAAEGKYLKEGSIHRVEFTCSPQVVLPSPSQRNSLGFYERPYRAKNRAFLIPLK